MYKITEVTGVPGAGKSYLYQKASRISKFDVVWGGAYLLLTCRDNQLKFGYLASFRSGLSFVWCLKLFFSFLAKIGLRKRLQYSRPSESLLIDEGITHLPINWSLSKTELMRFVVVFEEYFRDIEVIFVTCNIKIQKERLLQRGHKRIKTKADLLELCELTQHALIMMKQIYAKSKIFRSIKNVVNNA